MNKNELDNTTEPRSVDQKQACSDAPADPRCQKAWKKRGMHLADAALVIARNDDVSALLHDEDAMPVSVCLLAMIYGISDDVAANAVRHWLRRPNVSDQRPGDRDATKNKSSGIAGFAASDG